MARTWTQTQNCIVTATRRLAIRRINQLLRHDQSDLQRDGAGPRAFISSFFHKFETRLYPEQTELFSCAVFFPKLAAANTPDSFESYIPTGTFR
jgi:hypothetical protein